MSQWFSRRIGPAVAIAMLLTMVLPWAALADTVIVDGDGDQPVTVTNSIGFGTVCVGTTVNKTVLVALTREGNGQVFANNATVTIAGTASSTAGAAGLSASASSTITLPSNWTTRSNGTLSPDASAVVTLVAGPSPRSVSVSNAVTYAASGNRDGGGSLTRTSQALNVTASVVACDQTPPTLSLPSDMTVEAANASGAMISYSATATDTNPTNPTVTCNPASGTTFPLGTTTVTCAATDTAGNTATGSFKVTVRDTTSPAISGTSGNLTREATGASGTTVSYTLPTATDTVSGAVSVTCAPASGSIFSLGTTTVTCAATDAAGNKAESTFTVTVQDTTGPAPTLPTTIGLEATGSGGSVATYDVSATDLVDGSVDAACSPASGSTFSLGTTTVECSATDAAGNMTEGSFTVTISDTTAPSLSLPAAITAEATGPAGAEVPYSASASDVVDGSNIPVTCDPAAETTFALGETTVECSVTDAAGNTAEGSFTVTVEDTTVPDLTLPGNIVEEATSSAGAVATWDAATATDLVDNGLSVTCDAASGDTFPLGATTVTCSVTDDAGNTASGSFTVTVEDTTTPVVTPPANATAEATGPSGASVTYGAASADDIVDGSSIAASCVPASGTTFNIGTTEVTCSATDDAGNTGTATFAVSVVDTTAPVLTLPADMRLEATGPSGAMVSFTASATDIVDGTVDVSCTPTSGSTLAIGEHPIECSATDAVGNTATGASTMFIVTVEDTTGPAVSVPNDMAVEATGPSGAFVTFDTSATDIVDGVVDVTCMPASGSTFALGATPVNCSATDSHGNPGAASFTVTVVDTTVPELALPADITAEATSAAGAAVSFDATVTDLVDGDVAVTCAPASETIFALGETTIQCAATDAAGNTAQGSFTVTVEDTTGPQLTLSGPITQEATGLSGATVNFSATAQDLVDGDVTVTCTPASGSTFALGNTSVQCSAADTRGNTTEGSFTITVQDTTVPVVTVPDDMELEATGPGGATAEFTASASDLVDGEVPVTCTPDSGSTFSSGSTDVSCAATDAAGNTGSASFTVTVADTTAPVISNMPADLTLEATSNTGAIATWVAPTAQDIVDGAVHVTCAPTSGATFAPGTTMVTCSATDTAGNTAGESFTVTVEDTTAPTLRLPANITDVEAENADGAPVTFGVSAEDVVDGAVDVTCDQVSGSLFPLSTTTVTCLATDAAGNQVTSSFTITVVDTTAPGLILPADITQEATSATGAAVSYTATASDSVDGAVTPMCAPASGDTFALGATTVTCSATDAAGNTVEGNFTVTVKDTTRPILVGTPSNMAVAATSASGAVVTYTAPTATDVVSGTVSVSCAPAPGAQFSLGTTTVTCSATDAAGNAATSSFTVSVTYGWSGILQPVNVDGSSIFKLGSTVPVKFQLTGSSVGITNAVAKLYVSKISNGVIGSEVEATSTAAATTGNLFRYDATSGQYIFNWGTKGLTTGTYQIRIDLGDGVMRTVQVSLK